MAQRRHKYEFRPDPSGTNFFRRLYLTRLQRLCLLRWTLYAVTCVLLLVIQDSILSRFRLFGATTDLAVAAILLIGIHEGAETGGLFTLIASTIYWLSGSAPGPYVLTFLTFLVVLSTLLRQLYWRRSFGSTVMFTALCLMIYEMAVFLAGILAERTILARIGVFALTGAYSCVLLLPLYPVVNAVSKIGGGPWKE